MNEHQSELRGDRVRSNQNEKYNKILQAAIQVISEYGLDKASISDIVKTAGVAQGTFYLYFRSKNSLIPAIAEDLLTRTLDRIKGKISRDLGFWDSLKVVIDEIYSSTEENKDIIVLCYSGLAIDHSMEVWETIYYPYYQWFETLLSKAIERNEIVSGINVNWTAKMIINFVENAAERFYIGQDHELTLEASKSEVFQFLQRSLENVRESV